MCKYVKKVATKEKSAIRTPMNLKFICPKCRYGHKCKKQGKDNEPGECKLSSTHLTPTEEITEEKEE